MPNAWFYYLFPLAISIVFITQVELVTSEAAYSFEVDATVAGDTNGTLVGVGSKPNGGGWNLGDVRATGLDKILEDAVKATTPQQKSSP